MRKGRIFSSEKEYKVLYEMIIGRTNYRRHWKVVFFTPIKGKKKQQHNNNKILFTVVYKYWRAEIVTTFVPEAPSDYTPYLVNSL